MTDAFIYIGVFTRVKALMSGPDAGYIMCTDSPLIYDYVGQYCMCLSSTLREEFLLN